MGTWGNCDFHELQEFQRKIDSISEQQTSQFCEECAKELAARLLAKAIKRTPVGVYDQGSGKTGGTLRRGWTAQGNASGGRTASAKQYANSLKVTKSGSNYVIEITNPVEYASYVEFGHRTRDHKGWVNGKFMMTISEKEVDAQAPGILQRKLIKYLKGVFS